MVHCTPATPAGPSLERLRLNAACPVGAATCASESCEVWAQRKAGIVHSDKNEIMR